MPELACLHCNMTSSDTRCYPCHLQQSQRVMSCGIIRTKRIPIALDGIKNTLEASAIPVGCYLIAQDVDAINIGLPKVEVFSGLLHARLNPVCKRRALAIFQVDVAAFN